MTHSNRISTNCPPRRLSRTTSAYPSHSLVRHCCAGWAGNLESPRAGTRSAESLSLGCPPHDPRCLASVLKNVRYSMMAVAGGVRLHVLSANTSHFCARSRRTGRHLSRNPHRAALLGGRRRQKGRGRTRAKLETDAVSVTESGIATGIGRGTERGTEIGTGTARTEIGRETVRRGRVDKTLIAVADDEALYDFTLCLITLGVHTTYTFHEALNTSKINDSFTLPRISTSSDDGGSFPLMAHAHTYLRLVSTVQGMKLETKVKGTGYSES